MLFKDSFDVAVVDFAAEPGLQVLFVPKFHLQVQIMASYFARNGFDSTQCVLHHHVIRYSHGHLGKVFLVLLLFVNIQNVNQEFDSGALKFYFLDFTKSKFRFDFNT